ncbi:MAG: class I SAM-dependent methyltransferase [Chitinophagaceae bacterium]|nr:class I SAM-dependent methyltransferase [Chitinophagaceae bacterium]
MNYNALFHTSITLKQEKEWISHYFSKLNSDTRHFVNSNDICTPIECVEEMVNSIPAHFWEKENLKILDCCAGNGNFHSYISLKTPLKNLYFNEINTKRIQHLQEYFGTDIQLTTQDFLSFDETEKYDLVVANPPYAQFHNNQRVSKNHNLSRSFIEKALQVTKQNGYILFIVPNNWMSLSDRNILPNLMSQYQFIHLNIHGAKRYFPKVGSSFTWFLLQKTPNTHSFSVENHYIWKDTQSVTLDTGVDHIPLYYSDLVNSIFRKTIRNNSLPKYKIQTSSYLHRHTKKHLLNPHPDEQHTYKLIHTPSQTVWSKKPHIYQDGYKVFLSLSNQYGTFIDTCGMTQSIAFIRCSSQEIAEKIKQELDNPIYKFLNNLTRYGNFNNIRILQRFPLWESFQLTEEEYAFVQHCNQKYYGKKEK